MANNASTSMTQPTVMKPMGVAALVIGWLVPGAGHLIQGRWVRGVLLFCSIVSLFLCGLGLQGKVYSFNMGDLLDILGFIGDIGSGGLYLLTRAMDWGQGAIHRATADYGTKFMIVAGLLNIVAAIDAHHIAIGKKK